MDDWSETENEVVIREYFSMLEQELASQHYVKADHNRRVRELTGRSKGSVEFKFQNVSAALRDMHAPWIEGYKPARNYQSSLAVALEHEILRRPALTDLMRQTMELGAAERLDVVWNVIEPPGGITFAPHQRPRPLHTDFVMLESASRSLGHSGELLVLERERRRLREAGQATLAARVEHVSVTQGDGLGYDIASFGTDGSPRLLEVKTTRRGPAWPMMVSRNEVHVSKELSDVYVLARVFAFARPTVGLYELPGAISETCQLEPETWLALPKSA